MSSTEEERQVARDRISDLRSEPYDALIGTHLDRTSHQEVIAPSGARYDVQVQAFWDDPCKPGHLRVRVAIDPIPMSRRPHDLTFEDFILAPEGTFVGE
jgi:hypothetical protein